MVNAAQLEKALSGIDYPVDKKSLIDFAKQHKASNDIIDVLSKMPERQYTSPIDVAKGFGDVQ